MHFNIIKRFIISNTFFVCILCGCDAFHAYLFRFICPVITKTRYASFIFCYISFSFVFYPCQTIYRNELRQTHFKRTSMSFFLHFFYFFNIQNYVNKLTIRNKKKTMINWKLNKSRAYSLSSEYISSSSSLLFSVLPFSCTWFSASVSDLLLPTSSDFKNCVHSELTGAIVYACKDVNWKLKPQKKERTRKTKMTSIIVRVELFG